MKSIILKLRWTVLAGLLALQATLPAQAQMAGETLYNVFNFTSEATAEVDNDLMIATLVVQQEDRDPAVLADKVNSTMAWAIDLLRPFETVKTKTRDYQTYPRYDTSQERRLIGWRATQTLQLETEDFGAAGQAIQQLQEKLQVQGIRLMTKDATREKAADRLVEEALEAFKDRARLVQKNLGSDGYRILDVHIQTGQSNAPMFSARAEMADVMRSSVTEAPVVEAGTSRVTVQISGRVQLD